MADLLIKHLQEKANDHSDLTLLVNQWGFDEQLIPKALQSVGNLFPHYSRHDESHSKQILINIERLLGIENISKLSATDTWLLLEAAYWHDIGMVVPQRDIEAAFKEKEFTRYIEEIKDAPNHELHSFCLSFDLKDVNNCFKGADTPLDAVEKFRQLMAEWFRRKHAERSNEIVQAPWESVGLSSPRTELIPTRLFKLLGRICLMHGFPFKNIINQNNGLPFKEAGLAQEDCHPRFIACLLRMGDLLDLDDNRFCPVMQRIAGDNRPQLSKAHEEKHAAIRHLRVDRDRIEISAECESVDGYLETYKWFGWLKEEIQNQLVHWQDIVPRREYGLLPTLGKIKVKLSGEQQLLNEGKKPQFSMDREQATTLLQGSNLYGSKFACIRELLQNAVDATLLGLWLTKKEKFEWNNPLTNDVAKVLNETLVEIFITETVCEDIPDDKTLWTLTIVDKGTGISKEDLSYMLNIGGSRKNRNKHERINQMPEWMKPSGTFGIGFQSAFMIADKVKLTTKSIITNEILEVEMYSPTGNREGLVTIKNLKSSFSKDIGTKLEMTFLLDKKASKWKMNLFRETLSDKLVNNHDPLLDETFPYDAIKIFEEIAKFSQNSLIPIKSCYESNEGTFSEISCLSHTDQKNRKFVEVDEQQLLLTYDSYYGTSHNNFNTLYRGQPFEQKLNFLNHISVEINLLSGRAGSWLTINRDKLSESAKNRLIELTYNALKKQIGVDLTANSLDPDKKQHLSFFLKYMTLYVDKSWKSLSDKLPNQWQEIKFGSKESSTYKELSKKENWIISREDRKQNPMAIIETLGDEKNCNLLLSSSLLPHHESHIRNIMMNEWLKVSGHSITVLESSFYSEGVKRFRYKLSSSKAKHYSKKALATGLAQAVDKTYYNMRYIIEDINNEWELLALKKEFNSFGVTYLFDVPNDIESNNILLPFIFYYGRSSLEGASVEVTDDQLNKLVNKIQPFLKNEKATIGDVKKMYQKLIKYIDDLMKKSPFKDDWEKARN